MKKNIILFLIFFGACVEVLSILKIVPLFDQRYGLAFEAESEQFAATSLRKFLGDCASGDEGVLFAPTLRSGYALTNINQLCSRLTRQYGRFQALGSIRRFGKVHDTEGMLTFPYLAAARYESGAKILQIDVYKREQKWHIAALSDVTSNEQNNAIFENGTRAYATSLLATLLSNCNANNASSFVTLRQHDRFNNGDIVDFCLILSEKFGTFEGLGALKLFGMPTVFDTVYVYLAAARYDHGTPLLRLTISEKENKWYINNLGYFGDQQ
jgi:hypothetical protein